MYDVIVAGYGPTGMLAAILLGRAGHRVCVLERYTTLYNLPRVGIVHDDIQRMFQEVGILDRVRPSMTFLPVYELANEGRILLSSKVSPLATHGWPEFISVYQPAFEAELDALVRDEPNIVLHQGETVVAVDQTLDSVTVTTSGVSGESRFEAKYLIGADGGNSFVRGAIGIEYEDLGFDQAWLVIDARAKREQRPDLPYMRQFCEPAQPGMTMRMGPHHRRWSFMLFDGEDPAVATQPENVWRRLNRREGATPDEFELIRAVNYQFRSLLAAPWRRGRVFLAGDACHQMPPFLAQGLCSGFRDAHNLAWKLDLVLRGLASESLLDAYEQERGPNARATIIESAAVGQNVIERDPERARERDARLLAMQAANDQVQDSRLIAFRVPGFAAGVIADGASAAGDAFGQGRVRYEGKEGLFDDVAARGWLILARNGDPAAVLSREDAAFWRSLGGTTLRLGIGDGDVHDLDGYYTALLDTYACDAIVKRPDYYIYGASQTVKGLPGLLQKLQRQLA
jgi:2-polyprenyl-6-methoxyphenol hydroxylase-like FAD-dependent oxidoreductase